MADTADIDRELAARIAKRGREAGAAELALCRRWTPRIIGYGARHLREPQAADDLLQRVLLAVVQALRAGRVEDPARVGSYILTTCRHITWELNRRTGREDMNAVPEGLGYEPEWRMLDLSALDRCMGRLPHRERLVIVATFCEEQPSDRIAEALATTAGNVRVIRHRALAQLQTCMEGR
jgi:RNA polymerase sigma-70 factor (ECF subfamily)